MSRATLTLEAGPDNPGRYKTGADHGEEVAEPGVARQSPAVIATMRALLAWFTPP